MQKSILCTSTVFAQSAVDVSALQVDGKSIGVASVFSGERGALHADHQFPASGFPQGNLLKKLALKTQNSEGFHIGNSGFYIDPGSTNYKISGTVSFLGMSLGKGAQGTVFRGKFRSDDGHMNSKTTVPVLPSVGQAVAIKVVKRPNTGKELSDIEREIRNLELLRDRPHVMHLYDVIEWEGHLFFITEFIPSGELLKKIQNNNANGNFMQEQNIRKWFGQIVDAVSQLHQLGMAHRDLKPENILLDAKNDCIKLCDFGFSKVSENENHDVVIPHGRRKNTLCGTPNYAAPEILVYAQEYDGSKADIWSLGAILYEMVSGRALITGINEDAARNNLITKLEGKGEDDSIVQTLPTYVSFELQQLILSMLKIQPDQRADLANVKSTLEEMVSWFTFEISSVKSKSNDQLFVRNGLGTEVQAHLVEKNADSGVMKFSIDFAVDVPTTSFRFDDKWASIQNVEVAGSITTITVAQFSELYITSVSWTGDYNSKASIQLSSGDAKTADVEVDGKRNQLIFTGLIDFDITKTNDDTVTLKLNHDDVVTSCKISKGKPSQYKKIVLSMGEVISATWDWQEGDSKADIKLSSGLTKKANVEFSGNVNEVIFNLPHFGVPIMKTQNGNLELTDGTALKIKDIKTFVAEGDVKKHKITTYLDTPEDQQPAEDQPAEHQPAEPRNRLNWFNWQNFKDITAQVGRNMFSFFW